MTAAGTPPPTASCSSCPAAAWSSTRRGCARSSSGKETQGIESAFADVESLAERCRFADCRHRGEPGCAVAAAAESGELPTERLESYRKLQRELRQIHLRQDKLARLEEKRKSKVVHKAMREHYRLKPRG